MVRAWLLNMGVLALSSPAWAIPAQFAHQGRLLGEGDIPIEDTHTMRFGLYDAHEAGEVVWEESLSVAFVNGFYSVILGSDVDDNPLDFDVLDQYPLFLEVTVDEGEPFIPRHELVSVPYAYMADTCENVYGGVVDASEIRVDGELVINDDGEWVGFSPDIDWSDLTGIPEDFADGVDDDTTPEIDWSDLIGIPEGFVDGVDDDTPTELNWSDLVGIPEGFADGVDDDTPTELNWSDLVGIPDGFADGVDDDTTPAINWSDLVGIPDGFADGVDDDTTPAINWSDLVGIPDGFADGVDDDTTPAINWSDLVGIPDGFADGIDDDTTPAINWSDLVGIPDGFADDEDADSQLSDGAVLSIITDAAIDLATGTTIDGESIATGSSVPSGGIILWSGSDVPDGWKLCDGSDGTPDLQDRFVIGAGSAYSVGETGGSAGAPSVSTATFQLCFSCFFTTLTVVESVSAQLPPYYALAYIMKD